MKALGLSSAILIASSSVSADIITYSWSHSSFGVPFGEELELLEFPMFDGSIGSLDSVVVSAQTTYKIGVSYDLRSAPSAGEIIYDTSYVGGSVVFNTNERDGRRGLASTSLTPDGTATESLDGSLSQGDFGSRTTPVREFSASTTVFSDPSAVPLFVGSGTGTGYFEEDFRSYIEDDLAGCCGYASTSSYADVNYSLSYVYEPSSTPEPSSWMIMLVGIGFLGFSLRMMSSVKAKAAISAT